MGDALVLSESDCIEFTDNDIEGADAQAQLLIMTVTVKRGEEKSVNETSDNEKGSSKGTGKGAGKVGKTRPKLELWQLQRFALEGYLHIPSAAGAAAVENCVRKLNSLLGTPGAVGAGGTQGQGLG